MLQMPWLQPKCYQLKVIGGQKRHKSYTHVLYLHYRWPHDENHAQIEAEAESESRNDLASILGGQYSKIGLVKRAEEANGLEAAS